MPASNSQNICNVDAIVLGAGAAGMMCAAVAGQRGRRVLLLDHAGAPGKKILISGGGRCNFTNLEVRPECFLSHNRHFAKSALGRYRPADFIALVDRYGIAWHEKTLGQLFCDGSARAIVDMLLAECERGSVTLGLSAPVRDIRHADGRFTVHFENGVASAGSLVIATGGPSIPKIGASGFAYDIARQFGLSVIEPRPALVPLTLGEADADFMAIPGVASPTVARCGKTAFEEAFLFTHRGLSGPAILQISSYWRAGEPITLDLAPSAPADWLITAKRERPRGELRSALTTALPARLAGVIAERLRTLVPSGRDLGNVPDRVLADIERQLREWRFEPTGTEGYAKAEVTAGGIDTAVLSSRTLEAKAIPGLYVIGEAVDVTGWLGGYNFQWAWASGHAAGQAIIPT